MAFFDHRTTWREAADREVHRIAALLPADATALELKRAWKEARSSFTGGTSAGAKAWGKATTWYLSRYFGPQPGQLTDMEKILARDPSITFPHKSRSE